MKDGWTLTAKAQRQSSKSSLSSESQTDYNWHPQVGGTEPEVESHFQLEPNIQTAPQQLRPSNRLMGLLQRFSSGPNPLG
jgi:hypothetical protein